MMIREVLRGCDYAEEAPGAEALMNTDVSGIAYDSRNVKEGYLFVAIKGEKYDGHDFIGDAVGKGAVAAVTERASDGIGGGGILVRDGRKALACIANNFYGRPSESLTLIGITGTNGKTTTTYLLKSVLEAWEKNVGLIGTIRYMIRDEIYPAPHTTPESPEFQSLLRQMLLSGCSHVITEVSSHALAQSRVDAAVFRTAIFTNLTRDHLDFHKTMEGYFRAKERLFLELLDAAGTAVINLDDLYGERLVSELRGARPGLNILTYGLNPGSDIIARDIDVSFQGLRFALSFRGSSYPVSSVLTGMPNVYNIMSAVGAAVSLGIPWQTILKGVEATENIAGRFENVDAGQKFLCIIDYAHTEDALSRLISSARGIISTSAGHPSPRIITVFGCGGDRDRGKRPRMGEIATSFSDYVIITSDNPRSEDPLDIIRDIAAGTTTDDYLVEPDRREAIRKAVAMAKDGDIILIAGKGHEDYQEIKGVRHPFRDRDVAAEAIKIRMQNRDE